MKGRAPLITVLLLISIPAGAGTGSPPTPTTPTSPPSAEGDLAEPSEPASPPGLLLIDDGIAATLENGRELKLIVAADDKEGFDEIAARICGSASRGAALREANAPLLLPAPNSSVLVPYELMRDEYRFIALRQLFPADRFFLDSWEHRPGKAAIAALGEGLWQVALWFTGNGENWKQIAELNHLEKPDIPAGAVIRVPRGMLLPRFLPATTTAGPLRFGSDKQGEFAEYRLAKGEALYSSVVIRFTGLVDPDAVLDAAHAVAQRSGIKDVRRIAPGSAIKIPRELVAVRWLPDDDPRRVVATLDAREVAESVPVPAPTPLEGVHLLIDPGHGGDDIGTSAHSIWESDYVFDVACRLKRQFDAEPGVTVHLLMEDPERQCPVRDVAKLAPRRQQVLLTTPPFHTDAGEAGIAANLRWLLANDMYKKLIKAGAPPEKVVFLSLHADSLHGSVRGGMVYIPGEKYRRGTFLLPSRPYSRFKEYQSGAAISFSRQERLRDEAISRRLAESILGGYREQSLPVHDDDPIRDSIVRGRRRAKPWVPAVLRGNQIPAKVLVETLNINNSEDAQILTDPAGRERLARAVAAGLKNFYLGASSKTASAPPAGN